MLLHLWRHPPPTGAQGRCIGRTDLPVPHADVVALARRIRDVAAAGGQPQAVTTSPLRRCRAVGEELARYGWLHQVDPDLSELDFGAWDGLDWRNIARDELDAWAESFADFRPGGGESLAEMLQRARDWNPGSARVVVGHGGWIHSRRWLCQHPDRSPSAREWRPPPYGSLTLLAESVRP